MGKSSTAKKKRKGLTAQEKIVRKEVNRLDAKRNAMWHDHMDSALEALTPYLNSMTRSTKITCLWQIWSRRYTG